MSGYRLRPLTGGDQGTLSWMRWVIWVQIQELSMDWQGDLRSDLLMFHIVGVTSELEGPDTGALWPTALSETESKGAVHLQVCG